MRLNLICCIAAGTLWALPAVSEAPIDIGSRRELFADRLLIGELKNATLKMHTPQTAPTPERPRPDGHYATVINDNGLYRFYYRGDKKPGVHWRTDGWDVYHKGEVTLYAESKDGINWTKPDLGVYKIAPFPEGNVILADAFLVNHNFSPFRDERPGVRASERYKALGGLKYPEWGQHFREKYGPGGLKAYTSGDGIHWQLLREKAVIPEAWGSFDSQNVAFWSATEQKYVCYLRTIENGLRAIARSTSTDFINWTKPEPMNANVPGEHLYTNGTHPYFRAPHIYIALPTRFQAKRASTTDIVLMTSRGGNRYERLFLEAFIRPGMDPEGWGNRSNYASWNVVPTGEREMSIFVTGSRRYTLRYDGFVSINAPFAGGEMLTKPLTFQGRELELNFSTSAGGSVRVEIQDERGAAIRGFGLDECPHIIGDEIARKVQWKSGSDLGSLSGKVVRLRFVMEDADLYSFKFN